MIVVDDDQGIWTIFDRTQYVALYVILLKPLSVVVSQNEWQNV